MLDQIVNYILTHIRAEVDNDSSVEVAPRILTKALLVRHQQRPYVINKSNTDDLRSYHAKIPRRELSSGR